MNSVPPADTTSEVSPQIADHILLRRIGKGGYGEVWLAKNVIGGLRAAKVIYRKRFGDDRPFEREFEGICKFEPISRTHPGLVTILQVGQNATASYFYYVMELADDALTGQEIHPETYVPRTLAEEMKGQKRVPLETSLQIGLSLSSALAHLHAQKLIHRDIKPSNIIFVNGAAKFADIGLLTEAGNDVSAVGSLNYMPPEGPGEPTGDIFSLGKVFYELFMGMPCKRFPELPGAAEEFTTVPALLQLNNLILKMCHYDPEKRFQTAGEVHKELVAVVETVKGKGPGTRNETGAKTTTTRGSSTTGTTSQPTGGSTTTSGGERPKWRLSRRAVFIGLGGAIAGGAVVYLNRKGPPVVVLMDTTAPGGIYEKKPAPGANNTTVIEDAIRNMGLPPLRIEKFPIHLGWSDEAGVRKLRPSLVIVHRSCFFHPINAIFKYDRPPKPEDKEKFETLYKFADSKLILFMAYVTSLVPGTKFLVYSRGTDPEWPKQAYQNKWVHDIELAYPELKGRISTITIPGEFDGTFQSPDTRGLLRTKLVEILELPKTAAPDQRK